jgi:hypothetical protein
MQRILALRSSARIVSALSPSTLKAGLPFDMSGVQLHPQLSMESNIHPYGPIFYLLDTDFNLLLDPALFHADVHVPACPLSPLMAPQSGHRWMVALNKPYLGVLKPKFLECAGISIAYLPSARVINATHLLKLGNIYGSELWKFLSCHP